MPRKSKGLRDYEVGYARVNACIEKAVSSVFDLLGGNPMTDSEPLINIDPVAKIKQKLFPDWRHHQEETSVLQEKPVGNPTSNPEPSPHPSMHEYSGYGEMAKRYSFHDRVMPENVPVNSADTTIFYKSGSPKQDPFEKDASTI